MSSHHIVKDKQEPALIIANGETCSRELLDQVLEWSPYVVVLDGAIDRVLNLGIKIDVLFGDFDRMTQNLEELKKSQFPLEVVHAPDQDKTDLEKAIEFLVEKGHPAVNILWATGKRADHTMSNIANLVRYKSEIKLKIIDDYSCIFPILSLPHKFIKWYKAGTQLSLMPVGTSNGIFTTNLKYSLSNGDLVLGYRNGNSNEVLADGNVEIFYENGDLLIMECSD